MPTYEYLCESCDVKQDAIFKIAEKPESIPCSCGGEAKFILSCPMIQCDDPVNTPWLREFCSSHNRQGGKRDRFGDKPLQSRTDYKKYLEKHDLRPARGENLSEV